MSGLSGRGGWPATDYSEAIATMPTGEALQRAMAAKAAGRAAEADALCRAVLKREPGHLPATHLRAIIAVSRGDHGLAMALLRDVQAREPRHVGVLNQLASLSWSRGEADAAIGLCRKAAALAPRSPETQDNLGLAFLTAGRHEEAAAAFEQAIVLKPDFGLAICHLAIAREAQGRLAEADDIWQRASSRVSDQQAADTLRSIAKILQGLGNFALAGTLFHRAIARQPLWASPYLDMAYGMKFGEADRGLISEMQSLLDTRRLGEGARADLHFALGKALDDLCEFGEAMKHFDEANRLKRPAFDHAQHEKTVDWIIDTFNRTSFAAARPSQDQTPIIIFGMPRSGTTLAERTLSRHPRIGSGGELLFWGDAAAMWKPGFEARIAEEYLAILKGIAPGALRVIDKMPTNFFRLGLIHAVLPNARLIHCRRNPVDTCLSVYFTQFSTGHDYACDRGSIVFYYEQYLRLMDHWRSVLPADRMLEIDYENLVSDHETTARRLVAFSGLDWDDACLMPEAGSASVDTASVWQVRQPVYTSSKARWRNYQSQLGEFGKLMPAMPGP